MYGKIILPDVANVNRYVSILEFLLCLLNQRLLYRGLDVDGEVVAWIHAIVHVGANCILGNVHFALGCNNVVNADGVEFCSPVLVGATFLRQGRNNLRIIKVGCYRLQCLAVGFCIEIPHQKCWHVVKLLYFVQHNVDALYSRFVADVVEVCIEHNKGFLVGFLFQDCVGANTVASATPIFGHNFRRFAQPK